MSFPSSCWLWAAVAAPALAQSGAPAQVVITGNPLRHDSVQPASVLSGDALTERRAGTLGETLDGLPGVASTGFGPNVGRPVVRGLDGDRVRLLDNGGASVDASNLSFDHAVAIDPLAVERIEVLRGPAALLYGGNATGGVVNTIDNRIPRVPVAGFGGRAELRAGGAAHERGGAAVLDGGGRGLAWHADGFARRTSDLGVPGGVVRNSASSAHGGALGGGWVGDDGFAGLSLDSYRNRYGVVAEPDVFIRMRRERLSAAAERRRLDGWFPEVSAQIGRTRYRHEEVEGSEVGTTFASSGTDWRLQATHGRGAWTGVVGAQGELLDFSALGEEAFVPSTTTRGAALFVLESLQAGPALLTAGVRGERTRVASAGGGRFGDAAERRFGPLSSSLGASGRFAADWQWSATLGHTERAPAYYELYANGLHVATNAFERGDATLGVERSRHAELGLAWGGKDASAKLSVFDTRFARYIALDATGASVETDDGESVPEYAFHAVRARLRGGELEARWRLAAAPVALELSAAADVVRGSNLDSGEPLPRLAPLRLRLGLQGSRGAWQGGALVRHAADQNRVPATDAPTPGWTMLDLWLGWQVAREALDTLLVVKLNNATDRYATSASTLATLRTLSPLAGRAWSATLRIRY
jgi:iron complex outermembrane recepter protein